MKAIKKDFMIYVSFVLLLFIISYFCVPLIRDEIWNYGFSYNMAHGALPYRDFNMIVGPLYNFIVSIFLSFFGNHIFYFSLFNSLFFGIGFLFIFRKIGFSSYFLLLFLGILPILFNYNTFVAFLLIGILLLKDSSWKYRDFGICLLISLIVMTKQNIGIALSFLYFFTSKEKLKAFLFLFFPCLLFFLILFFQGILLDYIDFCYFGLDSFLSNFSCSFLFLFIEGVVLFLLGRRYFVTMDSKILYLIVFQLMAFPIMDSYHVFISLFPVFYYFLATCKKKDYLFLGRILVFLAFIIVLFKAFPFSYTEVRSFIQYRRVTAGFDSYLLNMTNYVEEKMQEYRVYLFLPNAYLIRLYFSEMPNFYDLINLGNLGRHPEKYLEQIEKNCASEKCLFVLDQAYFGKENQSQSDPIFRDYILKHYKYMETLPSKDRVYSNAM